MPFGTLTPGSGTGGPAPVAAAQMFRGTWSPDQLLATLDISDFPADHWTTAKTGYGLTPALVADGPGGENGTQAISTVSGTRSNTSYSEATLNMSTLGIDGITRVVCAIRATTSTTAYSIRVNGTQVIPDGGAHGWIDTPSIVVSSSDSISFRHSGGASISHASRSDYLRVSKIRVYGSTDPYLTGQIVVHNGRLWSASSDGVATEPGVAGWTDQGVATASSVSALEDRAAALEAAVPAVATRVTDLETDLPLVATRVTELESNSVATAQTFRGAWADLSIPPQVFPQSATATWPTYQSNVIAHWIDNNPATNWSGTTNTVDHYIQADLGAVYDLVSLEFDVDSGSELKTGIFLASEDGATFTQLVEYNASSTPTAPSTTYHPKWLGTVSARYVRVKATKASSAWTIANNLVVRRAPDVPPYDTGQVVTHLGRLWTSNVDSNVGIPGTSGWTDQGLATAASVEALATRVTTLETAPGGGGGGGGALANVKTHDLPLTTLTGWTTVGGTWTASATGIRQAATADAVSRLVFDTKMPLGEAVAEVEIRIDTAPNLTSSRAGFSFMVPSAGGSGGALVAFIVNSAGNITGVNVEDDALTAKGTTTLASPIPLGTFVKFRVRKVGLTYEFWVAGVLVGSAEFTHTNIHGSKVALYSYATDVTFRNLKIWHPNLSDVALTTSMVFIGPNAPDPALYPLWVKTSS